MKKILSFFLALSLVLSTGIAAFAEQGQESQLDDSTIIRDEYGITVVTTKKDDNYEKIVLVNRDTSDYIIRSTLNKESGDVYVEEIPKTNRASAKTYTIPGTVLNPPEITNTYDLIPYAATTNRVLTLDERYVYIRRDDDGKLYYQLMMPDKIDVRKSLETRNANVETTAGYKVRTHAENFKGYIKNAESTHNTFASTGFGMVVDNVNNTPKYKLASKAITFANISTDIYSSEGQVHDMVISGAQMFCGNFFSIGTAVAFGVTSTVGFNQAKKAWDTVNSYKNQL